MRLCSKKLNSTRQRVSVKSEDTNMLKANEHIGKLTSLNYLICYTHTQLDQLLKIRKKSGSGQAEGCVQAVSGR